MKWPLTWTRTRDADVAALRVERDKANADKRMIGAALSEMEVERLRKYEPVRREDGRFTAKAVRLRPASPPVGIAGHGLEDFA